MRNYEQELVQDTRKRTKQRRAEDIIANQQIGTPQNPNLHKDLMQMSEDWWKENDNDRYLDFLIPAVIIIVSVAIADMMSGFRLHEWLAALIG